MKVKLRAIMAGPNGTAADGQTITVDQTQYNALVDRKYAVPVEGGETAAIDVDAIRKQERDAARAEAEKLAEEKAKKDKADQDARNAAGRTPEAIKAAAEKLDPNNDEHWTQGGLPQVSIMRELTGSQTLSRADITAAGGFKKPDPATSKTSSATASSGARSSAP